MQASSCAAAEHVHDAKAPADDEGAAEQLLTCSGVALVATSKSFGRRPSSRSRTAPPTMKASKPGFLQASVTRIAFVETSAGSMP